ncbi:hypothetical protein VTJ04DRAFT_7945 [Mycothermus thermophilus]|uniref:uncharacterized protein n=1 Tax=Humicola insolens TaxID=85995 RepID=UPI0037443331
MTKTPSLFHHQRHMCMYITTHFQPNPTQHPGDIPIHPSTQKPKPSMQLITQKHRRNMKILPYPPFPNNLFSHPSIPPSF